MDKSIKQQISDTMRANQANKYGLDWLPASRGSVVEKKFVIAWDEMKRRCGNKKFKQYKSYGGRGIKVCERWNVFAYFFIDMWDSYLIHLEMFGTKDTSLDRINNNKGYSKINCKWSTRKEQQYNRTNTIKIKGKTLGEWSKELGVNRKVLYRRYWSNLPEDQILSKDRLPRRRNIISLT